MSPQAFAFPSRHVRLDGAFAPLARLCTRRPSSPAVRTQPRAQTWSDGRLTAEYIAYCGGEGGFPQSVDQPSVIIGAGGRIGNLIALAGKDRDWDGFEGDDVYLKRGEAIPDGKGPIYICTRASELDGIISACPEHRREDLVFMQNGYLENLLRKFGLDKNTQGNLFVGVPRVGAKPIDGVIPSFQEGLTNVTGKWAMAFQSRLHRNNLRCRLSFDRDFRRAQLEKLIWICAFNLVGAVHGNITMGEVATKHTSEVNQMVNEMSQMCRFTLTVGMGNNIEDRLTEYALQVKDFPTALKEFEWRNGFFQKWSTLATSKGLRDQTPLHSNYLQEGKDMGIIDW